MRNGRLLNCEHRPGPHKKIRIARSQEGDSLGARGSAKRDLDTRQTALEQRFSNGNRVIDSRKTDDRYYSDLRKTFDYGQSDSSLEGHKGYAIMTTPCKPAVFR